MKGIAVNLYSCVESRTLLNADAARMVVVVGGSCKYNGNAELTALNLPSQRC